MPHRTVFTQQISELGAVRGTNVEIGLGVHPISDDLRSLGLPKKPLMVTWAGKMVMQFGTPEKPELRRPNEGMLIRRVQQISRVG